MINTKQSLDTSPSKAYTELRDRFNSHLPKYGTLWRSMIEKENSDPDSKIISATKQTTPSNNSQNKTDFHVDNENNIENGYPPSTFLDSILTGEKVTINVQSTTHLGCDVMGCLGNCADPVVDIYDYKDDIGNPHIVMEPAVSAISKEDKSTKTSSTNTSGEDLASIAFDLSHLAIQSDDDSADNVDEKVGSQEGLNLTVFDEELMDDSDNEEGVSILDIRHEELKIMNDTDRHEMNQLDTSIATTLSCKEFVELVKQIDDEEAKSSNVSDSIHEESNIGLPIELNKKSDTHHLYKNLNGVVIDNHTKQEFIVVETGADASPSQLKDVPICNNDNDKIGQYVSGENLLSDEKFCDNINLISNENHKEGDSPCDNSEKNAIEDEEDLNSKEKDEFIESLNKTAIDHNDETHFSNQRSESEEADNEKSFQTNQSDCTSEEEWNDDFDDENNENEDSSSSSQVSSSRKTSKRKGSFTVIIVSDDDISYYDSNSDESNSNQSSDTSSNGSTDENKDNESEITIEENEEENNHFDPESESEECDYIDKYDGNSIVSISSSSNCAIPKALINRIGSKPLEGKHKIHNSKHSNSALKPSSSPLVAYKTMSKAAFKRKRHLLSIQLFNEYNKLVFENALSSVPVSWSKRLQTTAGLTRLKRRGAQYSAAIELSTKVIDDVERLRATLLHEMCHAAQWLVDGISKPSHGACFKKWAHIAMHKVKDVKVTTKHDYIITYKFAWACTTSGCSTIIKRHSRSVDPRKQCCGKCKGKLVEIEVSDLNNNKDNSSGKFITPKKKREASGFSLFVQTHSKSVRERLMQESGGNVQQKEVMKECGRLWKNIKRNQ